MTPEIAQHFAELAEREYPTHFANGACKRCKHPEQHSGLTGNVHRAFGDYDNTYCECRCHVLLARIKYRMGNLADSYYPKAELQDQLTEALANLQTADFLIGEARAQRDWLIKECGRVGVTVNVLIGAPLTEAYQLVNQSAEALRNCRERVAFLERGI